ncbi:MAG: GreA/GreB family elongation factor [Patescibacteria group bacterium]
MNQIEIKKKIIELSILELEKKMDFLKKAVDGAQKEAAAHKGRMESRYDTFREEAHAKRDDYKKQLFNIQEILFVINKIPIKITNIAQLGSIIEINESNYFISVGILNNIGVDGKKYKLISPESPIGQIFLGKKPGDEFEFRGKKIKINNIF